MTSTENLENLRDTSSSCGLDLYERSKNGSRSLYAVSSSHLARYRLIISLAICGCPVPLDSIANFRTIWYLIRIVYFFGPYVLFSINWSRIKRRFPFKIKIQSQVQRISRRKQASTSEYFSHYFECPYGFRKARSPTCTRHARTPKARFHLLLSSLPPRFPL